LPNRAKLVRAPAVRQKRKYRVDRQQNHAKLRELGDGGHQRGLLGNTLVVIANGISRIQAQETPSTFHRYEPQAFPISAVRVNNPGCAPARIHC
jgi:hypothetical protein